MSALVIPAQWMRSFYERSNGACQLRVTLSKAPGPTGAIRRQVVVFRVRRRAERIREAAFELPDLPASLLSPAEIDAVVERAFAEARQLLGEHSPPLKGGDRASRE